MFDPTKRFSFGVNLDDPWRFAGKEPPKSIIIPRLFSMSVLEHKRKDQSVRAKRKASLGLARNLRNAGVDYVRCWFPWSYFEPTPVDPADLDRLLEDSYKEWPFDDFVNIMSDHGIGLVPVLACGYQRMLPKGLGIDEDHSLYLKRAMIHARLLVRKYKDQIDCWQIENEPNWWPEHSLAGWRSGRSWIEPGSFRDELLETLNTAVHIEDSDALTIINLEADATNLDPGHYADSCDIIGLDFYPNYLSASPINTSVFQIADDVGKTTGKPTLVVETGYPSGPGIFGHTSLGQSEYVRRACVQAHQLDSVNGIGIWRYSDTFWRSFPFQENHFGLFDAYGNPKPAWHALTETVRELKS